MRLHELTNTTRFLEADDAAYQRPVTVGELYALAKYLDQWYSAIGIDVKFSRHFVDRANDARNGRPISLGELRKLFVDAYRIHGTKLDKLPQGAQGVLQDMSTNVNLPFVLDWNPRLQELDLIAKTVMRKGGFQTTSQRFVVEGVDLLNAVSDDEVISLFVQNAMNGMDNSLYQEFTTLYGNDQEDKFPAWATEFGENRYDFVMNRLTPVFTKPRITVWRTMNVAENFFESLLSGPTRLGIYWSFDKSGSSSYWGDGDGEPIVLEAQVLPSQIDVFRTIMANMNFSTGDDEYEITMMPKQPITLESVWWNGRTYSATELGNLTHYT